jgi:hypothetical protein
MLIKLCNIENIIMSVNTMTFVLHNELMKSVKSVTQVSIIESISRVIMRPTELKMQPRIHLQS